MAFTDIIAMINAINESILDDMTCENIFQNNDDFNNHLKVTISWFKKVSYVNKKFYLLALLEDVRSAWTLSLLLKSIWNCRPKDAVLSVSGPKVLSSYDQVPFDHNRTAIPMSILTQVMTDDRKWFMSLEPEDQALVLMELVSVAGGPVLWQVFHRAQKIYDCYREYEIENLKESMVVVETVAEPHKTLTMVDQKRESMRSKTVASTNTIREATYDMEVSYTQAQKQLDESLSVWNSAIKSIRDSFKLEEIETTFNDGTKKRIWKVDRPIPEVTETVDFLQLLPSAIGKRILTYLPFAQLPEYSRVNKYWAYLIDELKMEITTRQKINTELEKLREIMLRYGTSDDTLDQSGFQMDNFSSQPLIPSVKTRHVLPSIRASQKSGHYSFRHLREKLNKPHKYIASKPIYNMAVFYERLERRGAADENIWKWCKNVSKQYGNNTVKEDVETDNDESNDFQTFQSAYFKKNITVPLPNPLVKDPAAINFPPKPVNINIKLSKEINVPREKDKRFSLWSRDFSSLYPASKIASYQSPV